MTYGYNQIINKEFFMDERQEDAKPEGGAKPKNKHEALLWLLGILIVILLLLIGWLSWQWMECKKQETKLKEQAKELQAEIDKLKGIEPKDETAAEEDEVACNDTPTQTMKDNIKAALDTKNTAAFATYTSNPVKYVLAASEFGGDQTPDGAATSLEYTHSATGPWDFNLPAPTLADYDAGFYTDYFDANTYVGRSTDGMVVAFDFNCVGKISQIFVSASEDLL
jgi:hypothetical protein